MKKREIFCFSLFIHGKMNRKPCIFVVEDESNIPRFAQFLNQLRQDGVLSGPSYEYTRDGDRWCTFACVGVYQTGEQINSRASHTSKSKGRRAALFQLAPRIAELCVHSPYRLSFKGRPVGFMEKGKITFC